MHSRTLPASAGATFKPQHFAAIAEAPLTGGFFEVHAENYMGAGGPPHAMLERIRASHALSLHGVGLSLGGSGPLDKGHLERLKRLCARYEPESFSEHLAWSSHGGEFFADLLPLPYTEAGLARIAAHIDETQTALGRRMLLENPATYLAFAESEIPETAFLAELSRRTGCGLLLDINNVFVSAHNHGFDPYAYLAAFPMRAVEQIHLAGHYRHACEEGDILIDTHGAPVTDKVWALYAHAIAELGPTPTLIEWDNDVPEWPVLKREAQKAEAILSTVPLARSA